MYSRRANECKNYIKKCNVCKINVDAITEQLKWILIIIIDDKQWEHGKAITKNWYKQYSKTSMTIIMLTRSFSLVGQFRRAQSNFVVYLIWGARDLGGSRNLEKPNVEPPIFHVPEVPNVQMNEIKKKLNFLCGISSKFN